MTLSEFLKKEKQLREFLDRAPNLEPYLGSLWDRRYCELRTSHEKAIEALRIATEALESFSKLDRTLHLHIVNEATESLARLEELLK